MERKVLLVFNIRTNTGREQLSGIFRFMGKHTGWIPKLISSMEEFTPETVAEIERQQYSGIIINDAGMPGTAEALRNSRIPLVVLGIHEPVLLKRRTSIVFTEHDNPMSGRLVAEKFFSLGEFASFCYIHPRHRPAWSVQREDGFVKEINRRSKRVTVISTALCDDSNKLASVLNTLPRPSAILAANDLCAMEVLQLCNVNNIPVPRSISVISADNDEVICESTNPPLSSIRFNFRQDGYNSAVELENMMSSHKNLRTKTIICVPDGIVDRESAAPVAPSVSLVRRAMDYIRANACSGISSKDVARALGVSESLLSLRFREMIGKSVLNTIMDTRLDTVRHLLNTTTRPIAEITRQAGFRDANNLKRLFKNRTGKTMREYRRKG